MDNIYEVTITFNTSITSNEKECAIVKARSEWEAINKTANYITANDIKIEILNIIATKVEKNKSTGHYFLGYIIIE